MAGSVAAEEVDAEKQEETTLKEGGVGEVEAGGQGNGQVMAENRGEKEEAVEEEVEEQGGDGEKAGGEGREEEEEEEERKKKKKKKKSKKHKRSSRDASSSRSDGEDDRRRHRRRHRSGSRSLSPRRHRRRGRSRSRSGDRGGRGRRSHHNDSDDDRSYHRRRRSDRRESSDSDDDGRRGDRHRRRDRSRSSDHGSHHRYDDRRRYHRRRWSRSRSRSYDRRGGRYRRYGRGVSPATLRARSEQAKTAAEVPEKPKRFWDGFQWVEPQVHVVPTAAAATAAAGAAGTAQELTVAAPLSQQTRHERRLYVGNLPPGAQEKLLADFLNVLMQACMQGGGIQLPEGYSQAVLSVWIGANNNYAFVEFVSKECATIAMGLSGVEFFGMALKISRPNNYGTAASPYTVSQMTNPALTAGLMSSALGVAGVAPSTSAPANTSTPIQAQASTTAESGAAS